MAQEKTMFDKIKKQNGEHVAKTVRAYDNGIFDVPNLDEIIRFAGRDSEAIMNYLVSLKNIQIEEHGVHKYQIDMLKEAGYVAYVADALEKQNKINPFLAAGEELFTFRNDGRYEKYYMINAIKENVKDIKRENFEHPKREDEYGPV